MRRGLALAIPFFAAFGAFMFVFALAVQDGLRYSPVRSGLSLTPMMVTFLTGTLVAPRLVARFGGRGIAIALAAEVIALVGLAIQVLVQWPHLGPFAFAPAFAVAGFAQAIAMVTLLRTVLADVPHHLSGIGSGVLVTVQNASLALGVASLGSVYLSVAGVSEGSGRSSGALTACVCLHGPARGLGLILVAMAVLFGLVAVGSLRLLSGPGRGVAPAGQPEPVIEL